MTAPSVLIIGLGESGMAMVRHATRASAPKYAVRVYDSRTAPAQLPLFAERYPQITTHCGAFDEALLEGVDELWLSPGLSPHAEPLSRILNAAHERDIAVLGELAVFARALRDLAVAHAYHPKVLAITGTNGKTTVTSLTQHLCTAAGGLAVAAGNISPSMLDALCNALDADALPEVWVLELSSFQLQFTSDFAPDAATVLNMSQDHLDWHADMDEYVRAKAHIFGAQTVQVLNRDDAYVMNMARADAPQVSFGLAVPALNQQYGLWREGSAGAMDWLCVAQAHTDDAPLKKRAAAVPTEVVLHKLMPADALRIRGRHNAMNALAALALCRAIDLPLAKLLHGLRDYTGEPHRMELIARLHDVDVYDDSKGTNVGATRAAIEGLAQPIWLIAGGDGKGQDFSPLIDGVRAHVRAVFLIGKDAATIEAAWAHTGVPMMHCTDLTEATRAALAAAQAAHTSGAVLLSPACASLDMFKNYAHRAQVFVTAVHEWLADQGQVS